MVPRSYIVKNGTKKYMPTEEATEPPPPPILRARAYTRACELEAGSWSWRKKLLTIVSPDAIIQT
jgi:hypothetical protein